MVGEREIRERIRVTLGLPVILLFALTYVLFQRQEIRA